MKKVYRIKKNNEIDAIILQKKSSGDKCFVIYNKKTITPHFRFAISIGRKYGGAVERNKIKRQLRMIMHNHAKDIPTFDYVIVVKKDASTLSFAEIEANILKHLLKFKKTEQSNEKS
ncbi:MAG: ribonuclease P protein component [Tenericutes bacterium HGW-Tenericutes-8]|nr:MAG: ribonuclease P protein component [Tenericutes bacterium HGW-Tenericutes-8]